MQSIQLSDIITLVTVALCHVSGGLWWSNATQRKGAYLEKLLVGFRVTR
jgi:hypothetical protein